MVTSPTAEDDLPEFEDERGNLGKFCLLFSLQGLRQMFPIDFSSISHRTYHIWYAIGGATPGGDDEEDDGENLFGDDMMNDYRAMPHLDTSVL